MRYLLLALMVILLPLRGWMGDAMATDMAISMTARVAVSVANTTKTIAAGAYKSSADIYFDHKTLVSAVLAAPTPLIAVAQAHPDCSGYATGAQTPVAKGHDSNAMQDSQGEHCTPCQSCQACHTVALSAALPAMTGVFAEPATPHTVAVEFTSALAALSQKPPIS